MISRFIKRCQKFSKCQFICKTIHMYCAN